MKTGSLITVLILVVGLVLTAVAATSIIGKMHQPPQSSVAPSEEQPLLIGEIPEPNHSEKSVPTPSKQQYNLLFCMVSDSKKPEFSVHIHSDQEAIIVRQLSADRTENIKVELSAEKPVQLLADSLLSENELTTDGWAVVSSSAVAEALKIIGGITIYSDQDIEFEKLSVKRGTVTLGSDEIMTLLRDSTASGDAVNFKIKIINKMIATVSELSPLQQLRIVSRLTGEYKYDIDFDKVNSMLDNISNSKITVEKIS